MPHIITTISLQNYISQNHGVFQACKFKYLVSYTFAIAIFFGIKASSFQLNHRPLTHSSNFATRAEILSRQKPGWLLHSYRFTNSHVYLIMVDSVASLVASVAQQILNRRVAKTRSSRTAFTRVLGQTLSSSSWISTRPFSKSLFSDILLPRCAHTVHVYQLVENSERENHVTHVKPNNVRTRLCTPNCPPNSLQRKRKKGR